MMISAILLSVLYVETAAISLDEEPEDTSVVTGMSVLLRCVVSDWVSGSVLWYFHGKQLYISNGRTVYTNFDGHSRFTITGDTHRGEYFLNIRNVTAQDEGLYACFLFEDGRYRLSSRNAFVEVYPIPNHSFPVCSITPDIVSGGTGPGDWIVMTCVAEGGSPISRLDWVRDFEILPGSYLAEEEPKALYEFRLTEYHNGAVFSCVEANPGWAHVRSCSVMPFYYKTNVTLVLDKNKPVSGDDLVVKCQVEALPMYGLNYTWLLDGDDISSSPQDDNQFSFTDDFSEFTLFSVDSSLNNSVIECNVINIIELEGKASVPLKLQAGKPLSKLTPVESNPNRLLLALILGVVIPCLVLIILLLAILLYRRRRVGILHLLKERRTTLRLSERYTVHQRYIGKSTDPNNSPSDETGSTHSVLICATPREAIQEHIKELRRKSSALAHPTDKDGYLEPAAVVHKPRGRRRPTISGPISVVIPDLKVELRELTAVTRVKDDLSIDEDYVSDAETEWDH